MTNLCYYVNKNYGNDQSLLLNKNARNDQSLFLNKNASNDKSLLLNKKSKMTSLSSTINGQERLGRNPNLCRKLLVLLRSLLKKMTSLHKFKISGND